MDDTLYFFVNKHIYTVDSYWCIVGFLNSSLRHNGVDTSITLDATKWNCDGAELSSCIITFVTLSGQIYQLTFILSFYALIYIYMLLMYCDLHAVSFSTYI